MRGRLRNIRDLNGVPLFTRSMQDTTRYALDGMSNKGMVVDLELLLGEETLSDILAESAEEVVSISTALKA